jgi:hypothetical protein
MHKNLINKITFIILKRPGPMYHLTFMVPCIMMYLRKWPARCNGVGQFIVPRSLYMFQKIFLLFIRSITTLFTASWYYSHVWMVPEAVSTSQLYLRLLVLFTYVNDTRSCKYRCDAPDNEPKYRSKHVELSRNNKLSYTVASCWTFS